VIGDTITLFVNDRILTTLEDLNFNANRIGLVAGTFKEPNLGVYVDDVKIYDLSSPDPNLINY
jgi:hypothetical protein